MPHCTNCGTELSSDAQFCPSCGAAVTKTAPPPLRQPQTFSNNLFDRMIRAARLDVSLYEEVERDTTATSQALTVVILSSICSGIGTALSRALTGHGLGGVGVGMLGGLFSSLISWLVWSFITYFVGTKVFGGVASFDELLRTLGFSNSPGVLLFFSFIPILGGFISFAVWIWGLIAMIVAVRQALDFTTGQAILTCVVGFIAALVLLAIVGMFLAIPFLLFAL